MFFCFVFNFSDSCYRDNEIIKALLKKPAIKKLNNVQCPDGSFCPDENTCCKLAGGGYGCCPSPSAVCCSDGIHCCPHGFTCSGGIYFRHFMKYFFVS